MADRFKVGVSGERGADVASTAWLSPKKTTNVDVKSLPLQNVDGFSRVRVSSPGYRFDSQLTYQIDSDLWDQSASGDGTITHDSTNRMAALVSGATAGANSAILQSHYHAPYTPGRGQLAFITFSMPGTVPTNGEAGAGYYDGSNGVYLTKTAAGLSLNIKTTTSASDQSVNQADWNMDPFDGSGPSGITLDTSKTNILVVQLQALYVGLVVVGFDIDGSLWPAHAFYNANNLSSPYIAEASLPVRYWTSTSTDASSCTLNAICSSVISEGGESVFQMAGRQFVAASSVTNAVADTVLLVVRPKSQLNSINSHTLILPDALSVSVEDLGVWVEVRRNMTITAGTFEDVNSLSAAEVSFVGNAGTDPTVTADTGQLVAKFFLPATVTRETFSENGLGGKALLSYSHLLSSADNIVVQCKTGSTADINASIGWREIR